MSLQDWLKTGHLKTHKPGSDEISRLFAAADRDLADARVHGLSTDRRFAIAYNAALLSATAALAASGYRASQEGHHYWTFQSLAFTMQLDSKTIERLDRFRKKRNIADYEMTGMVSEQEVGEMLALSTDLRTMIEDWMLKNYPDLMK